MVSVLVVTCPCALSLATPAAITIASGRLTQLGLLIKSKQALETLAHASHFAFDKTGTLTQGKMRIGDIPICRGVDEQQVLMIAAALEKSSEHPIAQAFLDKTQSIVELPIAKHVHNQPGGGVSGDVDGQTWHLGSVDYIAQKTQLNLSLPIQNLVLGKNTHAATWVCLANTRRDYAVFMLQDNLRTGAKPLVKKLQSLGKQVLLLSGDGETSVKLSGQHLGIAATQIHFSLKPKDKLQHLKRLQQQGHIVAMIGDGINDAPVLAGAQVSIAMGNGTQLAAASADMVLLNGDLTQLQRGISIVRKTLGIIKQNLIWALAYNTTAVPLAVMGYVPPWLAAVGMSLSSLLVVLNALRLKKA